MKTNKSTLMSRAHVINDNTPASMNVSLAKAWACERLKKLLRESTHAIHIVYLKKDGSVRRALGTMNFEGYPRFVQKNVRPENPKVVNYYDIERGDFRCFKSENLIDFYTA